MIHVTCQCGKSYDVPDEWAGKSAKCKACGSTLTVQPKPEVSMARIIYAKLPGALSLQIIGYIPLVIGAYLFFAMLNSDSMVADSSFMFALLIMSAGFALVYVGERKTLSLACSQCGTILNSKNAKICPACHVSLECCNLRKPWTVSFFILVVAVLVFLLWLMF